MDDLVECARCENSPGDIQCSCGERFCEPCFAGKHLVRNSKHRREGSGATKDAWNLISGAFSGIANSITQATQFKKDEATKWFGLHVETVRRDRITTIVETPRFSNLMEDSLHFSKISPRRQFPSVTSFVGETGAGKSTLIRSLIYHSKEVREFDSLEAPVPGAQSGSSAIFSTTGEVNLYRDPSTFGTATPTFFADCEGMLGTEPLAAQHQNDWSKSGRRYLIDTKDGKPIDRRTAVITIYPRFLYIFSDVICFVTRNHKAWADSAVRLLNWSKVGAQNTINQFALPALIIILNGPTFENEAWVSDDHDNVTNDFFLAIEKEISENTELRELAQQHGDKTMSQLFSRSFSSVYVHYIPLKGYESLGTSLEIWKQTQRLAQRLKNDTERVQAQKAESWTRFDTKQMSLIIDYAFKHLASGNPEPFDFGQCRQQIAIPDTTETHFSEFLGHCLKGNMETKFDETAAVLASCLLRNSLPAEGKDLVLVPSVVFNKDIRAVCNRAMSHFLDNNAQCSFVDPNLGEKCVNTKAGHAKGHQSKFGMFLEEGLFIDGDFDSGKFLRSIETALLSLMRDINTQAHSSRREWQRFAADQHRRNIKVLQNRAGYPSVSGERRLNDIGRTSVCYGCLFGRPEYRLPCSHVICAACLRDFDQTDPARQYPGNIIHNECIVCADSSGPGWPYITQARPDLTGLRVLSLDGGGVRGIVELVVLRRLENLIGLGLPLGRFFDLVVGTSAGGLISLGLGIQARSIDGCIDQFRQICRSGFKAKPLTKLWLFGWLARWLGNSIYSTDDMETALSSSFGAKLPTTVYGLENPCRVAVTTIVNEDCYLITNYNRGGTGRYLNSEMPLWKAARCTSAAPMFFEPMSHEGNECRDGGLKENNPVQIAVNESKTIWGNKTNFDLVLSVGAGQAQNPQNPPSANLILPSWLTALFNILISTMNGEDAWRRYKECQDTRIVDRSSRLNVRFQDRYEPSLDDLESIPMMESVTEKYIFSKCTSGSPFSPISGILETGLLESLADRLRASMYFLQLASINQHEDASVIRGWICCRLGPGESGFEALLNRTAGFNIKGKFHKAPRPAKGMSMRFEITLLQQFLDDAIRIDVNFGSSHSVAISGFPMTLRALLEYWYERSGDVESLAIADLDAAPQVQDVSQTRMVYTDVSHELSDIQLTVQTNDAEDGTRQDVAACQSEAEPVTNTSSSKKAVSGPLQEELIGAAESGAIDKVLGLLGSGAEIDGKHAGWTALGRASQNGHLDVARTLIEYGASLDIRMDVGRGIIPGDGTALNWAAAEGHLGVVKLLVSRGAQLNIKAEKPAFFGTGGTPMTMAAGKGKLDVVRFLFEFGVDQDSAEGIARWDAFLCACEKGQLEVVKYFVQIKEFDAGRKTCEGIAPLHMATKGEQLDVMKFLVDSGAVPNVKDSNGHTPLHFVALNGSTRTAFWLRQHGADPRARNDVDETPLNLAKLRLAETKSDSNEELVECLSCDMPTPDSEESGCVLM